MWHARPMCPYSDIQHAHFQRYLFLSLSFFFTQTHTLPCNSNSLTIQQQFVYYYKLCFDFPFLLSQQINRHTHTHTNTGRERKIQFRCVSKFTLLRDRKMFWHFLWHNLLCTLNITNLIKIENNCYICQCNKLSFSTSSFHFKQILLGQYIWL